MLNRKGQTAVEVIIVSVVLLGMLLATSLVMVNRNHDVNLLAEIQRQIQEEEQQQLEQVHDMSGERVIEILA